MGIWIIPVIIFVVMGAIWWSIESNRRTDEFFKRKEEYERRYGHYMNDH